MLSIGWVIFWKAVILSGWATFQEVRDERRRKGDAELWAALKARFEREWNRRCAEKPRALTHLPADHLSRRIATEEGRV